MRENMNQDSIILDPDFRNAFLKHARKLYPNFSMSGLNWEMVDRVVMNELQRVHEENRRSDLNRVENEYIGTLGTQLWLGKLTLGVLALWILGLTIYVIVRV